VLRFEDYARGSREARTLPALTAVYSRAIAALGYQNCMLTSLYGRQVGHVLWFEIPGGESGVYARQRWARINRVLASSARKCRPFVWGEAAASGGGCRRDDGRECTPPDAESGIAFPFHAPGHRLDVLSISRRDAEPLDLESSDLLGAISFNAWMQYLDLTQDRPGCDAEHALTPRELEILDWCKKGKTRPEIGRILSISPKTVEFHLANVMTKLGASNQMAAVVIALQRGLLEL